MNRLQYSQACRDQLEEEHLGGGSDRCTPGFCNRNEHQYQAMAGLFLKVKRMKNVARQGWEGGGVMG